MGEALPGRGHEGGAGRRRGARPRRDRRRAASADGARRDRRRHRRERLRVGRGAARRGARRARRGPRRVQQRGRRRRRRRSDVGPHAQRLALGPRGERVGGHPRHQGVRAGDARRRRARPRRQHQRRATAASPRCRARRSTRSPSRRSSRSPSRSTRSCSRWARRIGASVLFPGPERAAHRPVHLVAQPARRVRQPAASRRRTGSIETFEKTLADARRRPRLHAGRGGRRPGRRRRPRRHVLDPPAERAQRRADHRAGAVDARPAPTRPTSATWEPDR